MHCLLISYLSYHAVASGWLFRADPNIHVLAACCTGHTRSTWYISLVWCRLLLVYIQRTVPRNYNTQCHVPCHHIISRERTANCCVYLCCAECVLCWWIKYICDVQQHGHEENALPRTECVWHLVVTSCVVVLTLFNNSSPKNPVRAGQTGPNNPSLSC